MIQYPLLWDEITTNELVHGDFNGCFKTISFYDWCILYKSLNSPHTEIQKYQKYIQDNYPLVIHEKNKKVTSMWQLPVENFDDYAIQTCNNLTYGLNRIYFMAMTKKTYNKIRKDLGLELIKNFQMSRKINDKSGTRQKNWERIVTLWSYRLDSKKYNNAINEIDGNIHFL